MRTQPLYMNAEEFRHAGRALVDTIANLLEHIDDLPVARKLEPRDIKAQLPQQLPIAGADAIDLLGRAAHILVENSTFTAHPRFFGYINGSVAPIGILGDMLASAINPNVGGWTLSPAATEIEKQTIAWLAEMIGYHPQCGGVLVSGGNMANMVGFLAARTAAGGPSARSAGLARAAPRLVCYVSAETHTWVQKAADLFGIGTDAVRWIETDADYRLDVEQLRRRISDDVANGETPFLVVATAGTVATGAIDPITSIAEVCRGHRIWLHVDGAYGAPAAVLPDAHPELKALALADSIAMDPHKWLHAPFEAGCALVREPQRLLDAFSYRPSYYHFEGDPSDPRTSFYELGIQNTRGFRALKVWLAIQHAGLAGYQRMIADDIALSRALFGAMGARADFEAVTQALSICTFRYVPPELRARAGDSAVAEYLDDLNAAILSHLQVGGELFVSNAVLNGRYVLRACITNWRTTRADVEAVPDIVAAIGERLHAHMRKQVRAK
ncbi:MAG: pyridoxal phosphate-dependent decarboxylase family protein [Gemmatimonadota bacterium]